jgi:hypothetical protein
MLLLSESLQPAERRDAVDMVRVRQGHPAWPGLSIWSGLEQAENRVPDLVQRGLRSGQSPRLI